VNQDEVGGRDAGEAPEAVPDPLAGFRNWRNFFYVALLVNVLFVYGMAGAVAAPGASTWIKTLSWFPFNVIATVLYYAFMVQLGAGRGGAFLRTLCAAMIAANWIAMIVA